MATEVSQPHVGLEKSYHCTINNKCMLTCLQNMKQLVVGLYKKRAEKKAKTDEEELAMAEDNTKVEHNPARTDWAEKQINRWTRSSTKIVTSTLLTTHSSL
jgi:hypothetical protein